MNYIEQIKNGIEALYKTNPSIHISVSKKHQRGVLESLHVNIVGVYKNIFQVEEFGKSKIRTRLTFQYEDVLIGQVEIEELDFTLPTVSWKTNN